MNEIFCAVPWNHLHVSSNGMFGLCCIAKFNDSKSNNFEEFWNSEEMKKIRLDMLKGTPDKEICARCLHKRTMAIPANVKRNEQAKQFLEEIKTKTEKDGSTSFLPKTLEIRADLCNFSCRICSPAYSTTIKNEHIKFKLPINEKGNIDSFEKIGFNKELLKDINQINWAGGEPFMSPIQWEVMDLLIELGNTNLKVFYDTNLSFPGNTLPRAIKLLNNFPNLKIYASLDGTGEDVEYIREGLKFRNFVENLKLIKKELPHSKIFISYTATSIGLLTLEWVFDLCTEFGIYFQGRNSALGPNHPMSINSITKAGIDLIFKELNSERVKNKIVNLNSAQEFVDFLYSTHRYEKYSKSFLDKQESNKGKKGYFEKRLKGLI